MEGIKLYLKNHLGVVILNVNDVISKREQYIPSYVTNGLHKYCIIISVVFN